MSPSLYVLVQAANMSVPSENQKASHARHVVTMCPNLFEYDEVASLKAKLLSRALTLVPDEDLVS
jgi:hypothetical protein